jgi:hypothetical protein
MGAFVVIDDDAARSPANDRIVQHHDRPVRLVAALLSLALHRERRLDEFPPKQVGGFGRRRGHAAQRGEGGEEREQGAPSQAHAGAPGG